MRCLSSPDAAPSHGSRRGRNIMRRGGGHPRTRRTRSQAAGASKERKRPQEAFKTTNVKTFTVEVVKSSEPCRKETVQ